MTRTKATGTILVLIGLILIVGVVTVVLGVVAYLLWIAGGFVAASTFVAFIIGMTLLSIGFELT